VQNIRIDVVSDVVCPWCLLGKARLEAALASLPDVSAEIHWRPYQLDPTIPRTGVDRKAYMEAKFGKGPRLAQAHAQLREFGTEVGVAFDFDAINISPNTMDAHRIIRWAEQAGPGIQGKVVDALFRAYFEQGQDIGSASVLESIAAKAGMDVEIVRSLLPTDAERAGVEAEIEHGRKIGITGVPCFIIDEKYAVMGAQTPQIMADAIRNALTATAS
jgi:predicted DsbA family dithiol-disulfide isomerase